MHAQFKQIRSINKPVRHSLLGGVVIMAGCLVGSSNALAQTTSAGPFAFPTFCYQNVASGQLTCGAGSIVTGPGATAYGINAQAPGPNSTAIGNGAQATGASSIALGAGSIAGEANTVSVGSVGNERRITNVAAGVNPTDAANVSQLSGLNSSINANLNNLQQQTDNNRNEARGGTAIALAATSLHYDPRPGKFSVAGGYGNYKGVSGLAVGLGYAVTDKWRVNGAFTGSPDVNDYGFVLGASFTLN